MGRAAEPLLDPLARDYIAWCERQGQPRNTVWRRRAVLRSVGNPSTATREEIEAWWERRTHLAPSSRANELALLRSFYLWCAIWEHRPDNPTIRLSPPKVPSTLPRPTTTREFRAILEQVKDNPPLRRAVLLGAWAGLRVSEAASLKWVDIDPDTRTARVTGKGNKTRTVKLSAALIDELLPDTGGNVVTGQARSWQGSTLGRKANAAIRAAGVDCTFHKLRHRYGTIAYQATKDPRALATQLGHASVSTTMAFYAAAADDAADAIADAVSTL